MLMLYRRSDARFRTILKGIDVYEHGRKQRAVSKGGIE